MPPFVAPPTPRSPTALRHRRPMTPTGARSTSRCGGEREGARREPVHRHRRHRDRDRQAPCGACARRAVLRLGGRWSPAVRRLARALGDAAWVLIYGELFGGHYPHPRSRPSRASRRCRPACTTPPHRARRASRRPVLRVRPRDRGSLGRGRVRPVHRAADRADHRGSIDRPREPDSSCGGLAWPRVHRPVHKDGPANVDRDRDRSWLGPRTSSRLGLRRAVEELAEALAGRRVLGSLGVSQVGIVLRVVGILEEAVVQRLERVERTDAGTMSPSCSVQRKLCDLRRSGCWTRSFFGNSSSLARRNAPASEAHGASPGAEQTCSASRSPISEFVEHYHLERNHQGLDTRLIISPATPANENADPAAPITRRSTCFVANLFDARFPRLGQRVRLLLHLALDGETEV
jgi:hypothetical protein